jgi:hypothetical protein
MLGPPVSTFKQVCSFVGQSAHHQRCYSQWCRKVMWLDCACSWKPRSLCRRIYVKHCRNGCCNLFWSRYRGEGRGELQLPSTGKITSLPDCPAPQSRWGLSIYSSATFLSCLPDFSVLEFIGKAEISIINVNSRDDFVKGEPCQACFILILLTFASLLT